MKPNPGDTIQLRFPGKKRIPDLWDLLFAILLWWEFSVPFVDTVNTKFIISLQK